MKSFLLLPFLFAATTSTAQQNSGIITYEQTIKLDLSGEQLPEGIAGLLPSEQKMASVLYFSPDASLYEHKESEKEEHETGIRSGNVVVQFDQRLPQEKVYTDFKTGQITEQKDFMDRLFLLDKKTEAQKWKFTGRQKAILDLPCMEALSIDGKDTLVAWYTTRIPVNGGPETFSGLPGMILEAESGSSIHIRATRIEEGNEASQKKIKAPSKGKKISREDYGKMVAEKTKEMQQQYGGEGNVIIMKQNR